MYFEAEVYGMLNWGFVIVMLIQLLYAMILWISNKFSKIALTYFLVYIILFSIAGYYLLLAINTNEHVTPMASEEASVFIAIAGISWTISVVFLFTIISVVRSTAIP